MKKIPNSYFDEEEFIVNEVDDIKIHGILGKNPSADQILKFELCTYISHYINKKN